MADTYAPHGGEQVERCPECGAAKYVGQPCVEEGTPSHAPVIPVLVRPVVAGRYTTIDWDELRDLADEADKAIEPEGMFDVPNRYAAGVRDTLRWLADGTPTAELLQLLGGK